MKLNGADPDFQRRDLFNAIASGNFPEFEFSIQAFDEKTAAKFPFDVLDATKLIPEEMVPLEPIGRMVLNRNPDNFFAETEQSAFHPGHIVPGIDFSNDPLLQGRLFSYLDTQLIRLGGANFHEIPDQSAAVPDAQLPARRRAAHRDTEGSGGVRTEQPRTRRPARGSGAWLHDVSVGRSGRSRSREQDPRTLGDLRGSLQPAAAVLALHVRTRAAPHRQRLHVRVEQGGDGRDPPPDARPSGEHRQRAVRARRGRARHGGAGRSASSRRARPST